MTIRTHIFLDQCEARFFKSWVDKWFELCRPAFTARSPLSDIIWIVRGQLLLQIKPEIKCTPTVTREDSSSLVKIDLQDEQFAELFKNWIELTMNEYFSQHGEDTLQSQAMISIGAELGVTLKSKANG